MGYVGAISQALMHRRQGKRTRVRLMNGAEAWVTPNLPVVIPVVGPEDADALAELLKLELGCAVVVVRFRGRADLVLDADAANPIDPYGHWDSAEAHSPDRG